MLKMIVKCIEILMITFSPIDFNYMLIFKRTIKLLQQKDAFPCHYLAELLSIDLALKFMKFCKIIIP